MIEARLLRIGEFSTLTRLSARMLRYYDANGVLTPAATDNVTGHRSYITSQVHETTLIRQLRDVGFSVSAIATLLPLRETPETLGRALTVQRNQLIADTETAHRRIAEIDRLISQTNRRTIMAEIIVTTHPAQRVVALCTTIDTYADEHKAWIATIGAARTQGIPLASGFCGATFHDLEYHEADVNIEVWESMGLDAIATDPLTIREIPEQGVAMATFRGGYDQLGPVNEELAEYIAASEPEFAGPMYNRYLVSPADTQNTSEYVTEVCMPVVWA